MSTELSERDRLFQEAKEKNAKIKAEETSKIGKTYEKREYDEIRYLGLDYDKPKLLRLLGNPKLARNNDPFSPKEINVSWIVGDNEKLFRCVWPLKEENPSWILWRIFDKVMSYKWDNTANGGKGAPIYDNSEKHPSLFKRVAKNNKDGAMELGWKPTKHVVWNCIDRLDVEYHKSSTKTKLLSRRADIGDDGLQKYPQPGIPSNLYDNIWNNIVEFYHNWEGYDIQITKQKTGQNTSGVGYQVICAKELNKIHESVSSFVCNGELTDFDKSLERINIDKIFQITSYQKILNHLGIFIQLVDATFNTKFYSELVQLADKEKKEWEIKNNEPVNLIQEPIPVIESRPVRASKEAINLDFSSYKGYYLLSESDKACILGINPNGTLKYSCKDEDLLPCSDDNCKFESPNTFGACPKCAIKYV